MTGKKIIMAVSGFLLMMYLAVHLLGNISFFYGPDSINSYAETLQSLGPFIWLLRIFMLAFLSLHIFSGISLTLENKAAKPDSYAVTKRLRSTLSARNMIWTGLVIAVFLLLHLLHFTFPVIRPDNFAGRNFDVMSRPDVFRMVSLGFRDPLISVFYIAGIAGLGLHLAHGIQSLFQSLGLKNERTEQAIMRAGMLIAVLLFLGFISLPVTVLSGLLGREIPGI
jgi:succinate dehydrogenase / fumarate reductase, cytochrome b subunit